MAELKFLVAFRAGRVAPSLVLDQSSHDDPAAYADWLAANRPAVQALVPALARPIQEALA